MLNVLNQNLTGAPQPYIDASSGDQAKAFTSAGVTRPITGKQRRQYSQGGLYNDSENARSFYRNQ